MTDIFSKEKRSDIMSKIMGKDTKLELEVFKGLRKRKLYFHRYYKTKAGTPDIALPRKKIAVFIDGDFWHGYRFDKNKTKLPKAYWRAKITNNIKRDRRNRDYLKRHGWRVLRVWEHQIKKDPEKYLDKIKTFLED